MKRKLSSWHDNKRALMLSNYIGKDPVDTCQRFDRKAEKKVDVDRPASVKFYNAFMGGVCKADMLLSLYRTKYRSRKWYHRVAFHLFSLAVCNSWIMHKSMGGNKRLVDVLAEICISLISGTSGTADSESMMFAPKFIVQCGVQISQQKCVMTNSTTGPFSWITHILRGVNMKTATKKQNINAQNVKFISVLLIIAVSEHSME